jgi:multidrug resistance efflux pump
VNELKPIPIPLQQRWREFRVVYLPIFTFVALLAAIAHMWSVYVQPADIVGEVESIRTKIISTSAGTLQQLKVDRLQAVHKGEVVAVVSVTDSDQLAAEIAAAEADLRVMKARMDLDRTRNLDAYSRLRLDLQVEQFGLEVARIRLTQAESEFERAKKLLDLQVSSRGATETRNDFGYDVALRDRDAFRVEVMAREKNVSDLRTSLQKMEQAGAARLDPTDAVVEQAIQAQRDRLERSRRPIELRAPIDGFVSDIDIQPGEKVTTGATIAVISRSPRGRK